MSQLGLDGIGAEEALTCRLCPSGNLYVEATGERDPTKAEARVARAFERSHAQGILHLTLAELRTELPATLEYWRGLGRMVVERTCGALDPLAPKAVVVPEPDPEVLQGWARAAPPMVGAELITEALLGRIWSDVGAALEEAARGHPKGLQGYLEAHGSVWNVVGRVCLHLAENKRDPEHPFAFLATYVHRVSKGAKPQHVPLGRALKEYAGAKDNKKLIALLAPLSRAGEHSELARRMVESKDVYHPLAWTPEQAHRFLREVPALEQAGLVVRLPDWWSKANRRRPKVSVTVGGKPPSHLGMDALLDFDVRLTLDGASLSASEQEKLLSSSAGLVLIKGKWVDVEPDQLSRLLARWQQVQAQAEAGGIGFAQAMRMLAGLSDPGEDGEAAAARPEWSEVVAGRWLSGALERLRSPEGTTRTRARVDANAGLDAELRPYQRHGVQWLSTLRSLGLGGCLADDMGLGKTIQVLGALSLAREEKGATDLLVVPASLIDNWVEEIARFLPTLKVLVAHPSHIPSKALKTLSARRVKAHELVITTYGTAVRTPWMTKHAWRNLVLDEAQAIKNPGAKQTRAIKQMQARWRLALTGTPVENRLGDLWSLFDFLNPGLLGSASGFRAACRTMSSSGGYAPLRELVQPYILRRLKTDPRVIADLPDKTEVNAYCALSKPQAALYQQAVNEMREQLLASEGGIARRGLVLAFLTRFKQICNHPCQWLGNDDYETAASGKFDRLREIAASIAARQDKVLVFTQYREMTGPLSRLLSEVFGAPGLVLHGGTPVKRRQGMVKRFQEDDRTSFMVLSLKAGGTGLNLTAASHVIHFDRWWNPAVENQATDRAFRIGQKKNVLVHKFICRGTVEERIDETITSKQRLSDEVLSSGPESSLTELSDEALMSMVSLDLDRALAQ